jgi:hypothetical protein
MGGDAASDAASGAAARCAWRLRRGRSAGCSCFGGKSHVSAMVIDDFERGKEPRGIMSRVRASLRQPALSLLLFASTAPSLTTVRIVPAARPSFSFRAVKSRFLREVRRRRVCVVKDRWTYPFVSPWQAPHARLGNGALLRQPGCLLHGYHLMSLNSLTDARVC